jgi:hypothetical protein
LKNNYKHHVFKVEYEVAYKKCCEYGLELMALETKEEVDCLENLMSKNIQRLRISLHNIFLHRFTGTKLITFIDDYWTSASFLENYDVPVWCSTKKNITYYAPWYSSSKLPNISLSVSNVMCYFWSNAETKSLYDMIAANDPSYYACEDPKS